MALNLRSDNTFVQDEGWESAAERYETFINNHACGKTVYLEIGVGFNTPGIIKFPFWRLTAQNNNSVYICINYERTDVPNDIRHRSICLEGDADEIVKTVKSFLNKFE